MTAILSAHELHLGYGSAPVINGLNLTLKAGEVVALLGPNGAGKTTTLLGLAGALPARQGEVRVNGRVSKAPVYRRCRRDMAFVTEERSVISSMSVHENLRVGRCDADFALDLFPELKALLRRKAGLLSGGEQQMLTLARALARKPKVLLADELSLGLAPLVVERLLQAVRAAADEGLAVLLVEQHVRKALAKADRVYVLRHGAVAFTGTAADAAENLQTIEELYLATA
ncbi:ABC transporter ATP-binding protein [Arthrobacter sp. MMS18-M83]|uniref:ABC transporter ATP-binding protein n=1 Tax=Arthrobacter sp. MMS18-M83 TaxID=2996261 RepID=UPI00227AB98D|nr:ABC transporter ATP-binding protein [Arthrobacter sp. MMS18-M83]WAH97635.1 ABC transporter ATP-binding protein [Arthrobacter sp. MMS18-M83]